MAETNLGSLLLERETAYLAYLQRHPVHSQRRHALAKARNGDLAGASAAFQPLAKRPEAEWWDFHNLGVALALQGQADQGHRWLRRALAGHAADPRIHIAMALSRWLAGDRAGAQESLAATPEDRRAAAWADAMQDAPATGSFTSLLEHAVAHLQQARLPLTIDYLAVQTGLTGGMKIFFEQANWLTSHGHRVRVLAYGPKPEWMNLHADFEQLPTDRLLSGAVSNADVAVSSFWTQNHDLERVWPATRLMLAQGDPYVWDPESLAPGVQAAAVMSHQVAAHLFAVSPALAARMKSLYGREAAIVPNGLDTAIFHPQPRASGGPLRILAVGRDDAPFKGLQDIFRAVELIRRQGVECELIWVSPADPATPDVPCRFYKQPSQAELAALYREADVFLSGSRYDSFQLTSLEAMACGTPVVAVDNEGLRTYARDGENCLLVPAGSPEQMASAALRLANSPDLRQKLVSQGLSTAAGYSWNQSGPRLEAALYRLWLGDLFVNARLERVQPDSISLCMIARNEEESIGRCLASVEGVVDEVIVVDTGSTDRTTEIALGHGARVYPFAWNDDFSAARNESLRRAKGEWILWLDADEELTRSARELLPHVLETNLGADGLSLDVHSLMDDKDPTYRITHASVRLFRNDPRHRFEGTIHEQIQGPIEKIGGRILRTELSVVHYGYLPSVRRAKRKAERNMALLQEQVRRNPLDSFARFNLGTEHYVQGDYAAARDEYLASYRSARPELRRAQYFSKLMRNLANCHRLLGSAPEALTVLDEAAELFPDYTDLWLIRGQVLEGLGDLHGALDAFEHCISLGEAPSAYLSTDGSGTWVPWCHKGVLLEQMGQAEKAIAAYATCLRYYPGHHEAGLRLGGLIARRDLPAALVDEAEKALEGAPFGDEVLAQSHYLGRRYARSAEFAERAPGSDNVLVARTAARIAVGDWEGAETLAASPLTDRGAVFESLKLRTLLAWQRGRWPEAERLYAELARWDPAVGTAFQAVGAALSPTGGPAAGTQPDGGQVLEVLEWLVDLGLYELFEAGLRFYDAQSVTGWRTAVGKMLHRKGFKDLAVELLADDAEGLIRDEEALALVGDAALDKGYAAEAETLFRKAMSLAAEPDRYAPRLAAALLMAGKAAEAERVLGALDGSRSVAKG